MDKSSKEFKNKRLIGLISLTIIVILTVVLVIYFVDKNDYKTGVSRGVGEEYAIDSAVFVLTSVNFYTTSEKFNLNEDECLVSVKIKITAKTPLKLGNKSFRLNGEYDVYNDFGNKIKIDSGETKEIEICYLTKRQSNVDLFVSYYGCKVAIGSTLNIE